MHERRARERLALLPVVTGVFVVFLLGVILAANAGWASRYFALVHMWPGGDKWGHFGLMGLLAFLLALVAMRNVRPASRNGGVILLLTAVVLVTAEEFSQIYLIRRSFSLVDLAADYAGMATGVLLARRWRPRP